MQQPAGNDRTFDFMDAVKPFGFFAAGPDPEGYFDLVRGKFRPAHIVENDGRFYDPPVAPFSSLTT